MASLTFPRPIYALNLSFLVLFSFSFFAFSPSYVYRDASSRWARYNQRMDQLAAVVAKADPDVVLFQEVRHDDSFGPPTNAGDDFLLGGPGDGRRQQRRLQDLLKGKKTDGGAAGGAAGGAGGMTTPLLPRRLSRFGSANASQAVHLMERLGPLGFGHFAYHPAMLYYGAPPGGSQAPYGGMREEEGPAVASKWPLVKTEHLLLPRDTQDGDDGHQRALLHAEVAVPGWGKKRRGRGGQGSKSKEEEDEDEYYLPGIVDVYSTHLSLSEKARGRSVGAMLAFADQGRGVAQVVAGDLNAEPDEPPMRCLRGDRVDNDGGDGGDGDGSGGTDNGSNGGGLDLCARWKAEVLRAGTNDEGAPTAAPRAAEEAARSGGGSDRGGGGGGGGSSSSSSSSSSTGVGAALRGGAFADAWLALHDEPAPRSEDPWEVRHALTFPSCNAVKRIDYVLVRGMEEPASGFGFGSGSGSGSPSAKAKDKGKAPPAKASEVAVEACEVLGQDPADVHYVAREGLGMLDEDSPVWASDHRAVMATLRLVMNEE